MKPCLVVFFVLLFFFYTNVFVVFFLFYFDTLMVVFYLQLDQAVEKELAWFRATTQGLENLKVINLDPDVIATQLYEQKVSFL